MVVPPFKAILLTSPPLPTTYHSLLRPGPRLIYFWVLPAISTVPRLVKSCVLSTWSHLTSRYKVWISGALAIKTTHDFPAAPPPSLLGPWLRDTSLVRAVPRSRVPNNNEPPLTSQLIFLSLAFVFVFLPPNPWEIIPIDTHTSAGAYFNIRKPL